MLSHAHVECRRCCLSPTMWEHVGSGASHAHVEGSGCCRLPPTVYKSEHFAPFAWVALWRPERPLRPPSNAGRQAQGQDGRHAHTCTRRRPNSLCRCVEGRHFSVLLSASELSLCFGRLLEAMSRSKSP